MDEPTPDTTPLPHPASRHPADIAARRAALTDPTAAARPWQFLYRGTLADRRAAERLARADDRSITYILVRAVRTYLAQPRLDAPAELNDPEPDAEEEWWIKIRGLTGAERVQAEEQALAEGLEFLQDLVRRAVRTYLAASAEERATF